MTRLSFSLFLASLFATSLQAQTTAEPQPDPSGVISAKQKSLAQPDWTRPLSELNAQFPAWIQFGGEFRVREEESGDIKFGPLSDAYLLSRLRLWINIHPVSWMRVVAETQDARAFFNQRVPNAPPYQNTFDIRQAYVEFGNTDKGWFDVAVGRQVLAFGEERLVGPSDWLNQGRTFDAVRLDVHHFSYKVSLFASSVIIARDGVVDHHDEGNNLHGVYATFSHLVPRASFEPYVLWRVAPAGLRLSENAGLGALNEVTYGFRVKGRLFSSTDYDVEMPGQTGSLGQYSIGSWAGHWQIGRTFPKASLKTRVFVEGNVASGTKNPLSRSWGTFDQIYPSGHDKLDLADQVGWKNIEQVRGGVEANFSKKIKATLTFEDFWLYSSKDALYASSGAPVARSVKGTAARHVGEELDITGTYEVSKAVLTGLGYGHLFTAQFLNQTTGGKDYNYPYIYAQYYF